MKLKTFIVVILATMALSLSAASAYQKKINEIYVKYYTLFKDGYSHELDLAESLIFVVDPEAMIAMAEMNALEWCSPNKLNQYIEQMKRELKQAESLMTAEDRKKRRKRIERKHLLDILKWQFGLNFYHGRQKANSKKLLILRIGLKKREILSL